MHCIIVDQVYETVEALKKNCDEIRVLEVVCWNNIRNVSPGYDK